MVNREVIAAIFTNLLQTDPQTVHFGNQAIFFKTHEHLFLDGLIDLLLVVVGLRLEFIEFLLVLEGIGIQFLLLLLHASVVDLLEVTLLLKLVVCGSGFLSNDAGFIEFVLKDRELIRKLSVPTVDLWDLRQVTCVELSLGFQFVPLLLEALQGALHAKLDKEVPQELVRVLLRLLLCTSNGSLVSIVTCSNTQYVNISLASSASRPLTQYFQSLLSCLDKAVIIV